MTNELDKVAEALHEAHIWKPACYVWEVEYRAEIVLDKTDVNPHFANRLIPLYTRDQVWALLKHYNVEGFED
jgi:hypothetical protein